MKHLSSIFYFLIFALPILNALPFSKILLKPEYQIHTTLDGPFSVFIVESDENQIEYSFHILEKENRKTQTADMIQFSDPERNIITIEYTTDFNEEIYNLHYHKHGNYEFNLKIGPFYEYIITMDKNRGIVFVTSYDYPGTDTWGNEISDEVLCIETGSIEIIEGKDVLQTTIQTP